MSGASDRDAGVSAGSTPDNETPGDTALAGPPSSVGGDWPRQLTILGVGLLGGSVAKAIRRACPNVRVVGWSRREATTLEALRLGVIDQAAASSEQACEGADVVVIATPVDHIAGHAIAALQASPPEALITDVGSTKATIVEQVSAHPLAQQKFVAAHPIAGREKSGVDHAMESLFVGRCVVLTPDETTSAAAIERAQRFWQLTGATTLVLDASRHDAYLAATSHVPHLVSAAVARLLPPDAHALVGTGWTDTTRVAAGDPQMWAAICRENREAIASELRRLADSVQTLCHFIDRDDTAGMLVWLAEAKMIRDQFS